VYVCSLENVSVSESIRSSYFQLDVRNIIGPEAWISMTSKFFQPPCRFERSSPFSGVKIGKCWYIHMDFSYQSKGHKKSLSTGNKVCLDIIKLALMILI